MHRSPALVGAALAAFGLGLTMSISACGGDGATSDGSTRPSVVVTYSVLGAVVGDLVGDAATVVVLIPNGADPHEWEPSAKDIETLNHADLIVRNGLDLEAGLQDALDDAEADGVPTFVASDHITIRRMQEGEGISTSDADQATGAPDPHLWMDPLTMRDVVAALEPELTAVGIDVAQDAATVVDELGDLDDRLREMLSVIPAGDRLLVTGHESLGYFAQRYEFRLVGAVVPGLTSQSEVSAGELADLADRIEETGAKAIFTEVGTSAKVAAAIGAETGVKVVDLASHNLPDDGSYNSFLLENAATIVEALT
jgi:zinc/manganese transport system substrate-binding protein